MSKLITIDMLKKHWPKGDSIVPGLLEGIISNIGLFDKYGFNSLAQAHIMGQVSLECGCGTEMEENDNYTAGRLCVVWPRHFNTNNAFEYAHNSEKLCNFIYEPPIHTDLGNLPNSSDGYLFRGRGLTQVTGRNGYGNLGGKLGINLIANPGLVNDPKYALECGILDFVLCGCLPYALADNFKMVTQKLNGGQTDANQRLIYTKIWKGELL